MFEMGWSENGVECQGENVVSKRGRVKKKNRVYEDNVINSAPMDGPEGFNGTRDGLVREGRE